jgi:endonuclease/exonuclease/phosphatase family metal-dependent hydrolase
MTRILSYNILVGGVDRVEQLDRMICSVGPDVVGMVEATNANVVEELAKRLNMQYCTSGQGSHRRDWNIAVLSRLPILYTQVHKRPDLFTRRHLLEVGLERTDGRAMTVFVIHLASSMHKGKEGNAIRRTEVQGLLSILKAHQGTPHLVMGDFNTLAPGDSMRSSVIVRESLRQFEQMVRRKYAPTWRQRLVLRTIHALVHSPVGGFLIERFGPKYAQGGIDLLQEAGYVDCYRRIHPDKQGYTFPASSPATRIDYLFASPELASDLIASDVVTASNEVNGHEASDHLPVWAEFHDNES